ncbi:hypothetical protein [Microbacter margulisiae]|uniref:CCR4-NOT transcriptional regulation complex NOT5 subunit n=1 Tax=Microbacter margulisiae TaxID=1350067 RepID=A0A7W5DNB7_9PORP|nr:hypothetical protein [Microbacter margulisiae]MBB3186102.1 CCR4-NOT transcriptional regulation complex NOT5 subunit [Microbacter margulisiae]
MDINELEKKIKQIATEKNIREQEVINGILANLELVYSPKDHSEQDREIIDGIKQKILSTLLNCDNQKKIINQATKYDELFDLDRVEMSLMQDAWNELEADRDVFSLAFEIGLTDEGIRKYR